jgi:hypothetical protein
MFLCLKLPCINSVRCEREALRLIPCWTSGEANLGGQNSGSLLPTNFASRRNKTQHKPRNNQNVFERKWSSARFKVTSCAFSVSIFYFRSPRFVSSGSEFSLGFEDSLLAAVHRRTRLKDRKGKNTRQPSHNMNL